MLNPKADIVFCRNFINSDGKISKNYFGYDDSFRVTNKQELLRSIFLKDTNYSSIDTPWSKIYSRQFINDNSIWERVNEFLSYVGNTKLVISSLTDQYSMYGSASTKDFIKKFMKKCSL